MRPKFEVGEVVLLRSRNYPELHGESVVREVYEEGTLVEPESDCEFKYKCVQTSYRLDISVVHKGALTSVWGESALRKKHTPGELSFTDLMASLSSPKLITHTP